MHLFWEYKACGEYGPVAKEIEALPKDTEEN